MNTAPKPQDKRAVFHGIILAWGLSLVFISSGYFAAKHFEVYQYWPQRKSIIFAILCSGLTLAAGIGWAARTRHFVSNIDGSAPHKNAPLDITLRYISNTLEQCVLFSISCTAFGLTFPEIARHLLPVMGIWFVIARITFWVGYKHSPLKRATGFAATFHPTLALMITALVGIVIL